MSRKCKYANCDKPAFMKILGLQNLCKKHLLIVRDRLKPLKAGRNHCIYLESLFKYLENYEKQEVTVKQIRKQFNITYPTAKTYLLQLQKFGFVKDNEDGTWKVGRIK